MRPFNTKNAISTWTLSEHLAGNYSRNYHTAEQIYQFYFRVKTIGHFWVDFCPRGYACLYLIVQNESSFMRKHSMTHLNEFDLQSHSHVKQTHVQLKHLSRVLALKKRSMVTQRSINKTVNPGIKDSRLPFVSVASLFFLIPCCLSLNLRFCKGLKS